MTFQVGIIGTGFGSKVHLPSYQIHKDFDVVAIAGRDENKTKRIAEEHSVTAVSNWEELLDFDLDVISVTTPPYLHYSMSKSVLESDTHLLLEKPTTQTSEQAKDILVTALNRQLIGMMCHEFRWRPERNYFAHLVGIEKIIGNLQEIHFQVYYPFASSSKQPKFGWLWDNRFEGGMLGALGSHLIDQIRHTTGLEFTEASGYLTTRTTHRENKTGDLVKVTADDGFGIQFKLENNVIGNLTASTTVSPNPESRFLISGDNGTIYLEGEQIFHGEAGNDFEKLQIPEKFQIDQKYADQDHRIPPFLKLLDQLSTSIERDESLNPNLTDGWRNQLVVDAVRQSHQTSTRIQLPR